MTFAVGFTLGIICGFILGIMDWPLPSIWICLIVGKWKFEQWHFYRLTKHFKPDRTFEWEWIRIL